MMILRFKNMFCFLLVVIGLVLIFYTWPTVVNLIGFILPSVLPNFLVKQINWCYWIPLIEMTNSYGFSEHQDYFMVLFRVRQALDFALFILACQLFIAIYLYSRYKKNSFTILSYFLVSLLILDFFESLYFNVFSDESSFWGGCLLGKIIYFLIATNSFLLYSSLFLLERSNIVYYKKWIIAIFLFGFWFVEIFCFEFILDESFFTNFVATPESLAWLSTQILASYGFIACADDPCSSQRRFKDFICNAAKEIKNVKTSVPGGARNKIAVAAAKQGIIMGLDEKCLKYTKILRDCLDKTAK